MTHLLLDLDTKEHVFDKVVRPLPALRVVKMFFFFEGTSEALT